MVHPIEAFREWYSEQLARSASLIPTACCLSTIGLDGYPNARFVSLKEVAGDAARISAADANRYFADRDKDTQIISLVSHQGQPVHDTDAIRQHIRDAEKLYAATPVPRPGNWSGFAIQPVRIELMEFRASRFHERRMFEKVGEWVCVRLQP